MLGGMRSATAKRDAARVSMTMSVIGGTVHAMFAAMSFSALLYQSKV
jgi:hypothetical protein